MQPEGQGWIVDELLARLKPAQDEQPNLCTVLKESEDLENGRGLIPVSYKLNEISLCDKQVLERSNKYEKSCNNRTFSHNPYANEVETILPT